MFLSLFFFFNGLMCANLATTRIFFQHLGGWCTFVSVLCVMISCSIVSFVRWCTWTHTLYVSGCCKLCLLMLSGMSNTVAVSQFSICILQRSIWRSIMSQCRVKAPPDAAHRCSFFSLILEDAPILSFVASYIPKFLTCPKKEERKRENGDIA